MIVLAVILLLLASLAAGLYFRNVMIFRSPAGLPEGTPAVSVLIPARNEELGIRACIESVLENVGVEIECIVLDDGSTDATAAIVNEIATNDSRIRLETAPPLPEGWSGKQHACFTLSKLAMKDRFCFLDADVTLHPLALAKMIRFQTDSQAELLSGFPHQQTGTILEKLLIPLIHFVLLCFLPISRMRTHKDASLGAGCGQLFLSTRGAYEAVGGHEAVKASFHDGVKLPRAYRAKGFMTDICDATDIASCRMYRGAGQLWNGLAKNAGEGLGSPVGLWFWTAILTLTQLLPWLLIPYFLLTGGVRSLNAVYIVGLLLWAGSLGLLVRCDAARRFRQSWLGALLHPLGIALLLGIQWYAALRRWLGFPVGWKGRPLPKGQT